MKARIVNAVAGLLVLTGLCGIASAKNCKDVTVKVLNHFEHAGNKLQIKAVDLKFWDNDDAKWRDEFGINNQVFSYADPGENAVKFTTRDLEHVGGEKGVRVRVQYKYLSGSTGGWSDILNADSDAFTCNADGPNNVTVEVKGID